MVGSKADLIHFRVTGYAPPDRQEWTYQYICLRVKLIRSLSVKLGRMDTSEADGLRNICTKHINANSFFPVETILVLASAVKFRKGRDKIPVWLAAVFGTDPANQVLVPRIVAIAFVDGNALLEEIQIL